MAPRRGRARWPRNGAPLPRTPPALPFHRRQTSRPRPSRKSPVRLGTEASMNPKPLTIGTHTASLPVVQGGMGVGISLSGLASAVANEGGIGVIATAGIGMNEPDVYSDFLEANKRALKREIQKAREKTKGLIGVNILVPLSNYADMARTAIQEKVDFIFSGAALPMNLPS